MKIISYFVLALVLINLFFLVGCDLASTSKGDQPEQVEDEDTGIDDVFEETEEVTPPPIPT